MTTNIDLEEVIERVEAHPDRDAAEVERVAREQLGAIAESSGQDSLLVLTERAAKQRSKRR